MEPLLLPPEPEEGNARAPAFALLCRHLCCTGLKVVDVDVVVINLERLDEFESSDDYLEFGTRRHSSTLQCLENLLYFNSITLPKAVPIFTFCPFSTHHSQPPCLSPLKPSSKLASLTPFGASKTITTVLPS